MSSSESTPPARRERWLNVPNAISVARLLVFVPLTIVLMASPDTRIAATVALALFGTTDWIDGFWARRFGQTTRVGEILDPVADRLGIAVICLAMTVFGILPLWILLVIVLVDLGLGLIGATRLHATAQTHVSWIGKIRTALIMVGLPMLLIATDTEFSTTPLDEVALALLTVGSVLHVVAGIDYALALIRAGRSQPRP